MQVNETTALTATAKAANKAITIATVSSFFTQITLPITLKTGRGFLKLTKINAFFRA